MSQAFSKLSPRTPIIPHLSLLDEGKSAGIDRTLIRSFRDNTQKEFFTKYTNILRCFSVEEREDCAFVEARIFELLKSSIYTIRDDESPINDLFRFLYKL